MNQNYQGIPGLLRPFKEYLNAQQSSEKAEVIFYGVPGTCSPFVELLCYAIRTIPCTCIFVPYLDEDAARKLTYTDEAGFQVRERCPITHPSVLVIMGGLAMPGMPVKIAQIKDLCAKYPDAVRVGICFMHMFAQAGWLEQLSFDLLIDANVQVAVEQKDSL